MEHPGAFIAEELKARDMKQKDLAEAIEMSPQYVNDVIRGKRDVGVDLAIKLSRLWGMSAKFWLNLQMGYDLAKKGYTE